MNKNKIYQWVVVVGNIVLLIITLPWAFSIVAESKAKRMEGKNRRAEFTAYIEGFVAGRVSATNTNSFLVMSNMLNTVSNKYVRQVDK